ncbi:MAG: Rid family hydrolase [Planctomycetota bacterium]|nr:Rid family hydrolase [Planctomycetota bacterium]
MSCQILERVLERKAFVEHCLSGCVTAETAAASPGEYFAQVASIVAQKGIQIIQDKVYGTMAVKEHVLAARAEAYRKAGLDASLPVTWLEGTPLADTGFCGLQIWGIAPKANGGTTVATTDGQGGSAPGRLWTGPGYRLLYLPAVFGDLLDGSKPATVTAQASSMFENAVHALRSAGFNYSQVIRTWIYLPRILDWYGEFNRVRTELYAAAGFARDAGKSPFPASPGIQARSIPQGECGMDVLALDTSDPGKAKAVPILTTPRQGPAFSYGSAFSRGMSLTVEDRKTVFLSGTASIDSRGNTLYPGNAEMQCLETLVDVAALLEGVGGSLRHIAMATLFCKTRDVFAVYRNAMRWLQAPEIPTVYVQADVCRPDLLVEMEAVAFV